MKRYYSRTPKDYDGTALTARQVSDLLPGVLSKISESYQESPDVVIAAWPDIIGPQLAAMTQVVSFLEGVLTIKVRNSTLYSLLSQKDKARILNSLRVRFPNVKINNIFFRMG